MQVTEEIVDMVAPVNAVAPVSAVPTRVAERIVEWENVSEAIQLGPLPRNQERVAEQVVDFHVFLIKEEIVDVVQIF